MMTVIFFCLIFIQAFPKEAIKARVYSIHFLFTLLLTL